MKWLAGLGRALVPRCLRPSLRASWILMFDYGHVKSMRRSLCVDAGGMPVPWFSYPAIEYLKQLDFSDCLVFEYGAGSSTLFWAARARRVLSVEHNPKWYEAISEQLPDNAELILETRVDGYVDSIGREAILYDVIVIDGLERRRCSRRALENLKEGGLVVLDNSDWYPHAAAVLRAGDLIQVDMTGFAPLSGHTTTTSFLLDRRVRLKSRYEIQPTPGPGSILPRTSDWGFEGKR